MAPGDDAGGLDGHPEEQPIAPPQLGQGFESPVGQGSEAPLGLEPPRPVDSDADRAGTARDGLHRAVRPGPDNLVPAEPVRPAAAGGSRRTVPSPACPAGRDHPARARRALRSARAMRGCPSWSPAWRSTPRRRRRPGAWPPWWGRPRSPRAGINSCWAARVDSTRGEFPTRRSSARSRVRKTRASS